MTEYIDVAAAKAFVEANYQGDPLLRHLYGTLLEKLPRVEAVEVVHGRWKFLDIDGWWFDECSICGNTTPNRDGSPPDWNYCPNCGAKMDGERKDND